MTSAVHGYCSRDSLVKYTMEILFYRSYILLYPVHEHNHTRFLVSEVLCSLVGPETQNVPSMLATSYRFQLLINFHSIIFIFKHYR